MVDMKIRRPKSSRLYRDGRVRRAGAAALEMAMVLPLLFLLVFGIIEMGRAIMVNQVITNAAREGARRAVIPGATDAHVEGRIDTYLNAAGISGFTRTISVNGSQASLSTAQSKDEIGISVSVPYSAVSYGIYNLIAPSRTFSAEINMRRE